MLPLLLTNSGKVSFFKQSKDGCCSVGTDQLLHPVETIPLQLRKYATILPLLQRFLPILGTVFPRFVLLTLCDPKEVSLRKQNPNVFPTTMQRFVKF